MQLQLDTNKTKVQHNHNMLGVVRHICTSSSDNEQNDATNAQLADYLKITINRVLSRGFIIPAKKQKSLIFFKVEQSGNQKQTGVKEMGRLNVCQSTHCVGEQIAIRL
jgi:hypothetical protein